ncbi:MAG: hypothetical protein JWO05_3765 [Gemmatimonadetes bacterium]|nr:hypothetical protein [Gemmatimonadota bacterium]
MSIPARHVTARLFATVAFLVAAAGCGSSDTAGLTDSTTIKAPGELTVVGAGVRTLGGVYTAEVAVLGTTAYTSTWSFNSSSPGRKIHIWNVAGDNPVLVDSIDVGSPVTTTGDVQVSDDGKLLMVATEYYGQVILYDLANPRKPVEISRLRTPDMVTGVHTAKFGRVNGVLYAFLAIDETISFPSRTVILDLSDPRVPKQVYVRIAQTSFVHDTFLRDGVLFLAHWSDGLIILDVGGGGKGGTITAPVEISRVYTVGLKVHNVWWLKDPVTGVKRFAIVGEEGPGAIGSGSSGDVHVVDLADIGAPREVAFYHVPGAGTHNFAVDEANGVLYAAYYNGGVQTIDVRGDLSSCTAAAKDAQGRCDLGVAQRTLPSGLFTMGTYIWGVNLSGGSLYASDMKGKLWKLKPYK